MKHKHYILFTMLLIACLLLSAGCRTALPTDNPDTTQSTTNGTTTATNNIDPTISLNQLRQQASSASKTVAVAYLGHTEDREATDLQSWIERHCPSIYEDYPFITTIDEDHIIGDCGELYCIVPTDPNASVTLNGAVEREFEVVFETALYQNESGEPILLWCNNSGMEPDVQVNITSGDTTISWYPQLADTKRIDQPVNDNDEDLLYDVSPYAQLLATDHSARKDSGWSLPTIDDLFGFTWRWEGYLKDDRYVSYDLVFNEWTVDVYWNDGFDDDTHEYLGAPYGLTYDEGFAVLEIDFREFAGKLHYNLLISDDGSHLYTMVDVSSGEFGNDISWEPLYRLLDKTTAPDPMEMVGSWVRSSYMADGWEEQDASDVCFIDIKGTSEDTLTVSYTNTEFSHRNYNGKTLTVCRGEIYTNCGNSLWYADVDYTGYYDTTYCITLLDDDRLMLQNYFLLDGAPSVSYEWFSRTE